jgi:hypothetical protein
MESSASSSEPASKLCKGICGEIKPLSEFGIIKGSGKHIAKCRPCFAAYVSERNHAKNPGIAVRPLRSKIVTDQTQECKGCGEVKSLSLFPANTAGTGEAQKTCQKCQGATKAAWHLAIAAGERAVGDGIGAKYPIVDGRMQCRMPACRQWKVLLTDFPVRANVPATAFGYFHECKDCRSTNALVYGHAVWNKVLRDRRVSDEDYRAKINHRARLVAMIKTADTRADGDVYNDEFGCTGRQLRSWIEFQFDDGMTWDNHGNIPPSVWTLDHTIALDRFELTDAADRRIAFHWTNLQPLRDNFKKHTELRIYEFANNVISAHRFIHINKLDMVSNFRVVADMRKWLKKHMAQLQLSDGAHV